MGILASPRKNKSNTLDLLKEALSAAQGHGFCEEIIHLCDYKIEFCRHCEACHKNILSCPIKDDVRLLQQKILEADAIIFASPVYIHHITGHLKNLLDRSSHFIHCQRLLEKYAAAVATSGGGPHDMVPEYIKQYTTACGARYVGGVSTAVPLDKEIKRKAYNLGVDLSEAIKRKKIFPVEEAVIQTQREYFKQVIMAKKEDWPGEYRYWKEQGWI
ncbi:flavodoxin family protein [Candidatus Velamenicoccus archaeovorus]|uniref:flavodoxin family protein n=1 Tax=Velamenicoccus archaeovorus TaxID=1930593 RepID=UPI0013E8F0E5|nr:flavodoxin family protein [Candidatus Velamenicoccus archaeovorus]